MEESGGSEESEGRGGEVGGLDQMASAIEDLLYMGVIRIEGNSGKKESALPSPKFSSIASGVLLNTMKMEKATSKEDVMKLMYYTLLIYLNENLKMPKSLVLAFSNDLEKNDGNLECSSLITSYVSILTQIWIQDAVSHGTY